MYITPRVLTERKACVICGACPHSEQILIHEFGHTVMDVGLPRAQRDAIVAAYQAARKQQLYDPDCYMAR